MIGNFAANGFAVFPVSESLLSKALPIGGAGCISATVNMNPAGIVALFEGWDTAQGAALQAKADAIRKIFQGAPMIPAMKRVVTECAKDPVWSAVHAPLCALDDATASTELSALRDAGFAMPVYSTR